MRNFKQWMKDKLFNLLTWLSPTEQPTPGEMEAWALEEAIQKLQQPQIWFDPTVRSYEQPRKIINPRGRFFQAHYQEFMPEPVRTNTEPMDKDFPPWLTGTPIAVERMTPAEIERVPTIRPLMAEIDFDDTEEVPAILKLLYQDRQQRKQDNEEV